MGEYEDQFSGRELPEATIPRLPIYLQTLQSLDDQQIRTVSSAELARLTGVNSATLRKDLSYLGSYGTRGVGYDVDHLIAQISATMGLDGFHPVLIIGAGKLGQALANYGGLTNRGFWVAGIYDIDPNLIGKVVAGQPVRSAAELARLESGVVRVETDFGVQEFGPDQLVAVLATPPQAAQEIADQLVRAGVKAILNFAPCVLKVPAEVTVRRVDLSSELQVLVFHLQRNWMGATQ